MGHISYFGGVKYLQALCSLGHVGRDGVEAAEAAVDRVALTHALLGAGTGGRHDQQGREEHEERGPHLHGGGLCTRGGGQGGTGPTAYRAARGRQAAVACRWMDVYTQTPRYNAPLQSARRRQLILRASRLVRGNWVNPWVILKVNADRGGFSSPPGS